MPDLTGTIMDVSGLEQKICVTETIDDMEELL
jgi:hypothetical protein